MNPFWPISISLSPNTEKDDIQLAFRLKFQPWRWKKGKAIEELEGEFKKYLGMKYAISFNSLRSAFLAGLKSLDLNQGDEILLQAFTCNAVANPIIWTGLKPVYVDCDEKNFNIDIEDLKRKITSRSKAVVVQHTFGLPADLDKILEICRQNNLILIEDCAHSLGATYRGKEIGTFGKIAFFSFSRDKVISSVYGGMATTNDEALAKKIRELQKKVGFPSYLWTFQQLLHPILLNYFVLPTYSFLRLGKTALSAFQWFQVLSKAVHWKEKRGKKPGYFPKCLPNALAGMACRQFKKLERFNRHRREIASFYFKALENTSFELPEIPDNQDHIFLRFTVKHPRALEIIKKAWQENILIGDWYKSPIAPHDTRLEKVHYKSGSCPKAEKLAKEVLNLPTHINISKKEAQKIVDFLKKYAQ
jgi:perosamine synthetase